MKVKGYRYQTHSYGAPSPVSSLQQGQVGMLRKGTQDKYEMILHWVAQHPSPWQSAVYKLFFFMLEFLYLVSWTIF